MGLGFRVLSGSRVRACQVMKQPARSSRFGALGSRDVKTPLPKPPKALRPESSFLGVHFNRGLYWSNKL